MAFEQVLKNLDDHLRTDEGCSSELDYVEQTSWVLFLKYLDDLEKSRKLAAELQDKEYTPIIAEGYRWNDWVIPLNAKTEDELQVSGGDTLKGGHFIGATTLDLSKDFSAIKARLNQIADSLTNQSIPSVV